VKAEAAVRFDRLIRSLEDKLLHYFSRNVSHIGNGQRPTRFRSGNRKERGHFEDLGIDGSEILKRVLNLVQPSGLDLCGSG